MVEIRTVASPAELDMALAVLDLLLGHADCWEQTRKRCLDAYRTAPDLLSVAVMHNMVVGAISSDGVSGINALGVLEEHQNRGIGRRLLDHAEGILRLRGAKEVSFGSLHESIDFYLRAGYLPQLLIQFKTDHSEAECIIEKLLAGLLANCDVTRAEWQGHPELWMNSAHVDWEFRDHVEAVADGVVGQYIMFKSL